MIKNKGNCVWIFRTLIHVLSWMFNIKFDIKRVTDKEIDHKMETKVVI